MKLKNPDKAPARFLLACALALLFIPAARAQEVSRDGALRKKVEEVIGASGAETVGVAFYDLETKRELLINPDATFHAASTMKVPVMMEVFRQAHTGQLSLDASLDIRNQFKSIADGSFFSVSPEDDSEKTLYQKTGQAVAVRELVELMINASSNLATNVLIQRVTPARIMVFMRKSGARNIQVLRGVEDGKAYERHMNNTTTAHDLSILLRRIAEGRAVSKDASREMIEIMSRQRFNEGIPAGLPPSARVAHKTGSITKINHDAAIV
ncbi:MAG TPA: serine hydrolase, partial [Pyrinomonadaceae bacterium]